MLITKLFPVIVLFLVSYALKEKSYSRYSRMLRLIDSQRHIKKRQSDPEYYEQCHFVNVWKEQLGHVSVLAFLDPTWQYSFRQAIMLRLLNARLWKSGFSDISFFVIVPPPNFTTDKTENDIEIEAWRDISMHEPENLTNVNDHFFKDDKSELIFVQDDTQTRMWESFRASKDQIVVIDRCGKLTYQVIVPWSILYFPYVKAAILSTYLEDPCGDCDPDIYKTLDYNEYYLNSINGTEKETESRRTDDVNANPILTTEPSRNITIYSNESLENEFKTGTILPTPLAEIVNNTTNFQFLNVTESFAKSDTVYQYDSVTEATFNENNSNADEMAEQEKSTYLYSNISSSILEDSDNKTTVTPVMESDIFLSINDSINHENMKNHSLLDKTENQIKNNLTVTIEKISNTNNNDKTVDINSKNSFGVSAIKIQNSKENLPDIKNNMSMLPLHIIMHAPHTHNNEKETKKHMHLILKTDEPSYHGHFDSDNGILSLINSWKDIDRQATNFKGDKMSGLDTDKETTNQKYTFDKDEGPGLHGEVENYWKSCEESNIADGNETSEDIYNNSTGKFNDEHYINNITDYTSSLNSAEINEKDIVELEEIDSSKVIKENDQVNSEEEMRNKLIQHYNKLLPWIYYILDK